MDNVESDGLQTGGCERLFRIFFALEYDEVGQCFAGFIVKFRNERGTDTVQNDRLAFSKRLKTSGDLVSIFLQRT